MLTNALGLGIVLTLHDQVTAGLQRIRNSLMQFSGFAASQMQAFDDAARKMVAGFASMIAGYKIFGSFDNMFGTSVAVSRNFEFAMARVQAVSRATGETFEALRNQALEMGRTTRFTAMDAAGAQETLIRTGRDAIDTISMLPSVLKLASAEGLTLAESADMVSSALRMFNMDATQANRVANIFAETSRSTSSNARMLHQALSYSGGTMGLTLGYSIEQTMAMLGVLHNAMQRGSRAGMQLRQVFSTLTPQKLKKLNELGIQTTDEKGEILSTELMLMQLGKLKQTMSPNNFLAVLSSIFPARAKDGAVALINEFLKGVNSDYQKLLDKYAISNASTEMSKIMDDTSQGAMFRLQSATEALRIAIGDQLRDAYDWVIGKMATFKGLLAQLIRTHPILTKAIVGLIGVLTTLAGTFLIVFGAITMLGGFVKMWQFLAPAAKIALLTIKTGAVSAISSLWGMSTPILALIGLAYGLYKAYEKNLWGIRDMFDAVGQGFYMGFNTDENGNIELPTEQIERMQKAGTWDGALSMGMAFYRFKKMWEGFIEGFKKPFIEIKKVIDGIAEAIAPVSKPLLELLNFDLDSKTESWKKLGEQIGYCAGALVIFLVAFKALKGAITIIHGLYWAFSGLITLVAANPIAAAIIAVIALIGLLYIYWDDFANWLKQLWQDIKLFIKGELQQIYGFFQMLMGIITLDWNKFVEGLKNVFEGFQKKVEAVLNFIHDLLQPIIDSIHWLLDKMGLIETDPVKKEQQAKSFVEGLNQTFGIMPPVNTNEALKNNVQTPVNNQPKLPVYTAPSNPRGYYQPMPMFGIPTTPPTIQNNPPVDAVSGAAPKIPPAQTQQEESGQSSKYLIQHNQNQAAMNGDATVNAMNGAGGLTAEVTNNVDVKIETTTTPVNLDGEKIGEFSTRYQENHATRLGRAGIFGEF